MSFNDSRECFYFFKNHNKEEIALCLLVAAQDIEELYFIKKVIMKKEIFNILFNNIVINNSWS